MKEKARQLGLRVRIEGIRLGVYGGMGLIVGLLLSIKLGRDKNDIKL